MTFFLNIQGLFIVIYYHFGLTKSTVDTSIWLQRRSLLILLLWLQLAITNEMFVVTPGFWENKFSTNNATYSPVHFIFLIHYAFLSNWTL